MGVRRILLPVALLALARPAAAAPPPPTVQVDADPAADLSGYRTYEWVERGVPRGRDPKVTANVKASIDRQLVRQGYAQSDTPDFMITFTLGTKERLDAPIISYNAFSTRRGPVNMGTSISQDVVTDGKLAIHVIDVKTLRPVWRASAIQTLPPSGASAKLIDRVVVSTLASFPARR